MQKIWKFKDDVDTDQIIPSQYLLLSTIEEMKKYTFETVEKNFATETKDGDIIIAGENFGCGSSREQAPRVLKELGIKAVIAKSFARIFFRNSINIGLPVIICEDIYDDTNSITCVDIDLSNGVINTDNKKYICTKLPEHMQTILNANGLIACLNREDE